MFSVNPPGLCFRACTLAGLLLCIEHGSTIGEYTKPWLTFEEQADLLMGERGLVADRDVLIDHLRNVGYYRLIGYWYIFKLKPEADEDGGKDERFVEGTTFNQIWKLYTFDRQFRLVVLDAIERVEVYFRTQLAYELAEDTGAFGFQDKGNLPRLEQDASSGAPRSWIARVSPLPSTSRRPTATSTTCRPTGFS